MTIRELSKVAARVVGEGTFVNVTRTSLGSWWNASVSFPEGETVECVARGREKAKRMLLTCLRSLAANPGHLR